MLPNDHLYYNPTGDLVGGQPTFGLGAVYPSHDWSINYFYTFSS